MQNKSFTLSAALLTLIAFSSPAFADAEPPQEPKSNSQSSLIKPVETNKGNNSNPYISDKQKERNDKYLDTSCTPENVENNCL